MSAAHGGRSGSKQPWTETPKPVEVRPPRTRAGCSPSSATATADLISGYGYGCSVLDELQQQVDDARRQPSSWLLCSLLCLPPHVDVGRVTMMPAEEGDTHSQCKLEVHSCVPAPTTMKGKGDHDAGRGGRHPQPIAYPLQPLFFRSGIAYLARWAVVGSASASSIRQTSCMSGIGYKTATSKRKTREPKEENVTVGPVVREGDHVFGVAQSFTILIAVAAAIAGFESSLGLLGSSFT